MLPIIFYLNKINYVTGTNNIALASNCFSGVKLLFCFERTVIRSLSVFRFLVWYLPVFCFTGMLSNAVSNCRRVFSLGEKCVKANYFVLNCCFIWDVFVEEQLHKNLMVKQ